MLREEIEQLLARGDLRSSDRANLQRMLHDLKDGKLLSVQEREVLWTYIQRYQGPLVSENRQAH